MSRMFFVVESDHHKTRGHQTRVRDVRGSPELHEDEHLPGELWPLVLAQIKVRYCGQSPTMCPPGLLVFIFIHYFIGSTSWHSLANCLLLFVIWLCRYTLPHRRKVSRMGGGNVFWSAKEQVRQLEKLEIVEMKEVLICRATWITLLSPPCDPPSLLRDVNQDNVIARLLQIR